MAIPAAFALMGIDKFSNGIVTDQLGENMAKIVRQHAIASTAVSLASAIPGAGAVACVVCQTAVVYSMYVRMNNALGIRLSKNVVKSVASAVVANIATNAATLVGGVVASAVLSVIPGVGSVASTVLMGGIGYATVMISGLVYAKMLCALAKNDKNVETMSEDEIKEAVKAELNKRDVNQDFKTFTKEYKQEKKNGAFENAEAVELEAM